MSRRAPAPIPPELEVALACDNAAFAKFSTLPPSHQRQYAQWVGSAVRPDTRQRRAASAMAMLKAAQEDMAQE